MTNKLRNITNKNNNYVESHQNNYPDELERKRLVISLQTHTPEYENTPDNIMPDNWLLYKAHRVIDTRKLLFVNDFIARKLYRYVTNPSGI